MPKTIGGLFGRSAMGPIHELALKVRACTSRLEPLLEAFAAGERKELRGRVHEMRRLEGEADTIKQEIRASLSGSIFSSVSRAEVILLVKTMDNVADECERLANLLLVRRTSVPPELVAGLRELQREVAATVEAMAGVTGALHDAEGRAPSSGQARRIIEAINRVARREHEADRHEGRFMKALFAIEERLGPIDVIFLMRAAETLGRVADHAENTADVLRRLVPAR